MATRLIKLGDGVLVEIEAAPGAYQQIAAGAAVDAANAAIQKASNTLIDVCQSLAVATKRISETAKVSEVEAEVGLAFEAEGNLYITKAKGSASITVKIKMSGFHDSSH